MQLILSLILAVLIGYYISARVTTPVLKRGQKRPNPLPSLHFRNIDILPALRIHTKHSTIWVHHWVFLTVFCLGVLLLYENIMQFMTIKATAAGLGGAIIQGLTYPDRFKFKHPRIKK